MKKFITLCFRLEIWVVGSCVAVTFISQQALPWAVCLVVLFGLLRWTVGRHFRHRTPADGVIGIFLLILMYSLVMTANKQIAYPQLFRVISGIGIYYAIVNWKISPLRFPFVMKGLFLLGLLLALFALISVQWNTLKLGFLPAPLYAKFQVLVTDPVNPNVMAGALALILSILLGVLVFNGFRLSHVDKFIMGGSALIIFLVLLLTQSRGGIFALGVAIFVIISLVGKRARWFLAALTILILFFLAIKGPMPILNTIMANASLQGVDGRIEVWARALYMIEDFPFTGVGMGSYQVATDLFYPLGYTTAEAAPHAHNLFLQVGVDLGIPGLVAWLAIWFTVISVNWQVYRVGMARSDKWISGLGAGLIASQVTLGVHGLLDSVTWGMVKPAPIVWAICGLSVVSWYLYRDSK